MINDLNWDNVFSDNVDLSARLWSQAFLGVMKECIPQRTLKPQKSVPWVTNDIVKLIRDRNICYQRAKRSSDPSQLALYKTLRNKVVDMLRSAKRDFFNSLLPSNSKQFWKVVKLVNKQHTQIPSLYFEQSEATTHREKADMLNSFFSQVLELLYSSAA